MDFLSKETANHLFIPIGYNQVRKIIKRGAKTRSAFDQFTIHTQACSFVSDIIKIPKVYNYNQKSYTMDMLSNVTYIPEHDYGFHPALFSELLRFFQYMMKDGYWPMGFTIYRDMFGQYMLIDFSHFGYIDGNCVHFPKDPICYSIDQASMYFGLKIYVDPFEKN